MKNLDNYAAGFSLLQKWRRLKNLKREKKRLDFDLYLAKGSLLIGALAQRKVAEDKEALQLVLIEYQHLRFPFMRSYLQRDQKLPKLERLFDSSEDSIWESE